jgi:predicted lipoprotein with Yx(FWY)xxD motif
MKKQLSVGLAVMALAASLTACGGGSGTTTTTSAAAPASESPAVTASASATSDSATVDLKTASSSKGDIVVDGKGMSVYYFTKDVKDSGKSNCTGDCLVKWPPVFAATDTPKVEGVTGTVGTIDTPGRQEAGDGQWHARLPVGEGQGPGRHYRPGRRQRLVPRGTRRDDDEVKPAGLGPAPLAEVPAPTIGARTHSESSGRNLKVSTGTTRTCGPSPTPSWHGPQPIRAWQSRCAKATYRCTAPAGSSRR